MNEIYDDEPRAADDTPIHTRRRRILKPEPLWWLRGLSHGVYIQSDHWRLRRQRFLESCADDDAMICGRCGLDVIDDEFWEHTWYVDATGKRCTSRKKDAEPRSAIETKPRMARFDVHHLSYANIGAEPDEDLELVCHPCHNLNHFPESDAAVFWAGRVGTGGLPQSLEEEHMDQAYGVGESHD